MHCRVCDGNNFSLAIDLKDQPWGNHFLKESEVGNEPFYPLRVIYCHDCQTAQLDFTVKKEIMFADHTYLSGITKSLREHFNKTAQEVKNLFCNENKVYSILDIGSNDGTQLACYKELGFEVLGVESSKGIAEIANKNGIPTINDYFNLEVARKLNRQFDVINASGVFFHLEELHSVTQAIKESLTENGVFVVQFLYMKSIMENVAFDQIYHEHLLYYTLKTIEILLNRHGLALFDAKLEPIHGGSIIGYIAHKGLKPISSRLQKLKEEEERSGCNEFEAYQKFANKIEELKEENIRFLKEAKKNNKIIYGMGAPVKGNTLLNYFGIGQEYLDCLVEKNQLREGLYSPGKHLPIRMEDKLPKPPDVYYVLAWNFKNEILKNNKELIDKGVEFFFPINA